jgi:hypothetical protein
VSLPSEAAGMKRPLRKAWKKCALLEHAVAAVVIGQLRSHSSALRGEFAAGVRMHLVSLEGSREMLVWGFGFRLYE